MTTTEETSVPRGPYGTYTEALCMMDYIQPVSIHGFPAPKWEMAPTGDFDVVTFRLSVAPNAFHRLMQRVFFGFAWRKIK